MAHFMGERSPQVERLSGSSGECRVSDNYSIVFGGRLVIGRERGISKQTSIGCGTVYKPTKTSRFSSTEA